MTIIAHTDGASRGNPGESGIGVILRDDKGKILFSGSGYIGRATNNIAEYSALLACLRSARKFHPARLIVHSDSELMVRQLKGEYRVRDKTLQKFFRDAKELLSSAPFEFQIVHIERADNGEADRLANEGIEGKRVIEI